MALNVFISAPILEESVNCLKQLAKSVLCKALLSVISTFKCTLSTLYLMTTWQSPHAINYSISQMLPSLRVVNSSFKQFRACSSKRSSVNEFSLFLDNPVELFVCETDNGPAWKTVLGLSHIHMVIYRKSVSTHTSMAKTNNIMVGVL